MADALVKFVGAMILCLALIIHPVIITTMMNENTSHRLTMNAVQNYLDIVTDKGQLTLRDYEYFLEDLHAIGLVYDVSVIRTQRLVYPGDTTIEVTYVPTTVISPNAVDEFDDTVSLNAGDVIEVSVESYGRTQGSQVAWQTFGLITPEVSCTLSRVNRN
jgi:hypothetical protein